MGIFDAIGSIVGGLIGQSTQEDIAARNIAMQREFAQQGIGWRAEDATRAQEATGINRLTLLGAPTSSFSNVVGDNSLGEGVGKGIGKLGDALQSDVELKKAQARNLDADTVGKMAAASSARRVLGSPGNVPLPPEDPRGPIIPLLQRARDPRTGEIVWIPSEKAASPLQTIAASPLNATLAARDLFYPDIGSPPSPSAPDIQRNIDADGSRFFTPF